MKKWMIGCAALLTVALAGCSGGEEKENANATTEAVSKLDDIQEKGKIVIATGNYYPFEYLDPATNELVGYDIDLGNHIAEELGVDVEWKEMQFQALIPTIQNDQADLVLAAMYITEEREAVVDFPEPYLETGMVLVRQKDDTRITSVDALDGMRIGVKSGATSEKAAKDLKEQGANIEVVSYKETVDYLLDLEMGRLDAAMNDYLNQLGYFESYPDSKLEITGETFTESHLGMAVAKGETELVEAINEILADMDTNGEKDALFTKWIDKQ